MNLKSTDLDAIFNGAGAVINTTQNITQAIASGINEVQGIMDNSRRNAPMMQAPAYQQPVTYGYGYGDSGYNGYPGTMSGYNYNPQQPQMNMGYPGFTNPNYGSMAGVAYNPGYHNGPQGGAWL